MLVSAPPSVKSKIGPSAVKNALIARVKVVSTVDQTNGITIKNISRIIPTPSNIPASITLSGIRRIALSKSTILTPKPVHKTKPTISAVAES